MSLDSQEILKYGIQYKRQLSLINGLVNPSVNPLIEVALNGLIDHLSAMAQVNEGVYEPGTPYQQDLVNETHPS